MKKVTAADDLFIYNKQGRKLRLSDLLVEATQRLLDRDTLDACELSRINELVHSASDVFENKPYKQSVSAAKIGSVIRYCDAEWIVLDQFNAGTLLIRKNIQNSMMFGNTGSVGANGWIVSYIYRIFASACMEYYSVDDEDHKLAYSNIKFSDLADMRIDLTADSGEKYPFLDTSYNDELSSAPWSTLTADAKDGFCREQLSLLTKDQVKQYRDILRQYPVDNTWWTVTASCFENNLSTVECVDKTCTKFIEMSPASVCGVRPVIMLKPNTCAVLY